jgi:adenine-specific DNA-methyltransferase
VALASAYRKADGEMADDSTLQGQLNNYTKKFTFDYFIHKNLGDFLTRELDFYVKNISATPCSETWLNRVITAML